MKTLELLILAGDERINRMMRNADVFENDKALGELFNITITYDEKHRATNKQRMLAVRDAFAATGKIVSAIMCKHNRAINWVNPEVKTVSNGKTWFQLKDWMNAMKGGAK